jgi:5-methyltetrahydropteroyltriglutamate--homocysteine methyltransferase
MTARTKPPFRADHVGSLLRPKRLADARAQAKEGKLPADALKAVEDECIREAVALQEGVGLHAVTDGEFRRDFWHIDFLSAFDGIETVYPELVGLFTADEQPPTNKVTGKVKRSKPTISPF